MLLRYEMSKSEPKHFYGFAEQRQFTGEISTKAQHAHEVYRLFRNRGMFMLTRPKYVDHLVTLAKFW
jgi:hypothetical protein